MVIKRNHTALYRSLRWNCTMARYSYLGPLRMKPSVYNLPLTHQTRLFLRWRWKKITNKTRQAEGINVSKPEHHLRHPTISSKLRNILWGIACRISSNTIVTTNNKTTPILLVFSQKRTSLPIYLTPHSFLQLLLHLHTFSWLLLFFKEYWFSSDTPHSVASLILQNGLVGSEFLEQMRPKPESWYWVVSSLNKAVLQKNWGNLMRCIGKNRIRFMYSKFRPLALCRNTS